MFDSNSRYYGIETGTLETVESDGERRDVRYVLRRFIPRPEAMTTLAEHIVGQGERLDNITARYLGDPTAYWRICDANGAMRPDDVTEEPGRIIRIALPQP
jgi:hypothetical protein